MGVAERATGGGPSIVSRRPLFDRLSGGLAGGVILLSAPPGSGKTMLLRSWLDATGLQDRTASVAVEQDERDPQRFWLAVVEALREVAGDDGPIAELAPAPQFDGATVVERLIAGASSLAEPVILAIDDLQHLRAPGAMEQLDMLLGSRPAALRVILATRHDPPLSLHRLRLTGGLTEIRAADLRFTPDEAAQLFAAAGVSLATSQVDSLLVRTEGWAAGLRLAALSLARHPDPERFVAQFSGSDRAVADYLIAEVLDGEPPPVRELLLRTSILERVSGSLADHLLRSSGSERILLDLEDAGAFVFALDAQRSWFRYHNLFGDLLLLELRRTDPGSVPGLHRDAALWFAQHSFPIEAIRHAQAAEDWRLAGDLLGRHGFGLALDGSFATMRALLDRFPPDAFENPELAAFLAYGEVIRSSPDTSAAYVAVAERYAAEVPPERRQAFRAMLAAARLTLARWRGDYSATLQEVGPLLEPAQPETIGQVAVLNDVKAVALMSLGIVELWAGAPVDAERHLEEAADLARRIGRPYVEQGALAHLALAVGRSSVVKGRELASRALGILERYGWLSEPIAPVLFAAMGAFGAAQGRLDESEPWLDRAEQALSATPEPAKELLVRFSRGMLRIGQGRLKEAVVAFAETRRLQASLVDPDPLGIASRGLLVQALVRLGDLAGARSELETASDPEREFAESRTGLAAIHLAEREPQRAIEVLAPVLTGSARAILDLSVVNALVLAALARAALGDARAAEEAVERALDLAEPEALVFPFLVTPARDLLEHHPRHRTTHAALLGTILDVVGGASAPAPRDGAVLQEALTDSEIRVLRYLPSNLSAPEIAAEVFLSTSTVKTHMRHVYEKLGVHRRTDAVVRARELGLLGPTSRVRR